jgi:hypothetical protein
MSVSPSRALSPGIFLYAYISLSCRMHGTTNQSSRFPKGDVCGGRLWEKVKQRRIGVGGKRPDHAGLCVCVCVWVSVRKRSCSRFEKNSIVMSKQPKDSIIDLRYDPTRTWKPPITPSERKDCMSRTDPHRLCLHSLHICRLV